MISYLSKDSKACANCHVMLSSYNSWKHSSHYKNALCADCHIPHENPVRTYVAKASDGFRHAYAFTFNTYDQVIRATDTAKETIQQNCIRCHENQLLPTPTHNANLISDEKKTGYCWRCHQTVPHGKGSNISTDSGLSSSGNPVMVFPK